MNNSKKEQVVFVFDLDLTLINGDSMTLWCQWLCENNFVTDIPQFLASEQSLINDYKAQKLNIAAYISLALKPVIHLTTTNIDTLVKKFIEEKIKPIIITSISDQLKTQKHKGDTLIISSSPHFLVEPIAKYCFAIENSFGIRVKTCGNQYTNELTGLIPYKSGKLAILQNYLQHPLSIENCYFYTDSINDLSLLEAVDFPFVVNPDIQLETIAIANKWPIILT